MKEHLLVKQVRSFIQKQSLFLKGDVVLVGVSGGADSVALLRMLVDLKHILGINIIVAHYDHALRTGSGRDALFVEKLAESLALPCVIRKRKGIRPKGSIEEYARKMRYTFFQEVAQEKKADVLALAHTQDDLAETVFMRILRGTGMEGVRAILPKRRIEGLLVVRPILTLTRKDVESFLSSRRQEFITDPTNLSDLFLRNIIRRKVFPFIERTCSHDIKVSLSRLAHTAASDYSFIEKAAEDVYQKRLCKGGYIALKTHGWERLHPSIRRVLIRMIVVRAKNDFKFPSLSHVESIDQMVLTGEAFLYRLPGKINVTFKQNVMSVHKN